MRSTQLSFDDLRSRSGRGGPRSGAGRPRGPRPIVYHVRRESLPRDCPAHVTLRIREGLPSLRRQSFVRELRRSFAAACERGDFRIVQFSVQFDHLHLLVKAPTKEAFQHFLRTLTTLGARLITGAKKGLPQGKFWDAPAYSRIIPGGAWPAIQAYFNKNRFDAIGFKGAQVKLFEGEYVVYLGEPEFLEQQAKQRA